MYFPKIMGKSGYVVEKLDCSSANDKISDHFYNVMNVLSETTVYMLSSKWLEIKI